MRRGRAHGAEPAPERPAMRRGSDKEVRDEASLLCDARLIRRLRRRGKPPEGDRAIMDRRLRRIDEPTGMPDALAF